MRRSSAISDQSRLANNYDLNCFTPMCARDNLTMHLERWPPLDEHLNISEVVQASRKALT